MKKILFISGTVILICYLLIDPKSAIYAAGSGLTLWYDKLLPVLLPFAIFSNILIESGAVSYLTKIIYPLSKILPFSPDGLFVAVCGLLFGFPMGAKLAATMYQKGNISQKEAELLCIAANNMSPAFVGGYVLCVELCMEELTIPSYLIIYMIPVICGMLLAGRKEDLLPTKKPASGSYMNFKIIDAGIMNGFETLTKLGGYIMIFSMTSQLVSKLPLDDCIVAILSGMTEVTGGIHCIATAAISDNVKYIISVVCISFGGISGIAQTSAMLSDTAISIRNYIRGKIIIAAITGVAAYLTVSLM